MEKNWIKIATYSNALEVEIVRQMLEVNEIAAVVINKQDSSYLFGKIELYVAEQDVLTAKQLIEQEGDNLTPNSL
ncbi:DUF2007 domain-containing protein [Sphingobacteriaceae bacterium WQ 2009]|uniref:DUF2007 domain-containing protein n=1 Tax=Rhinopithecimicrobium faecis TaxID=2820698 RepID=A0A8T4HFU2_9SPHI|nr:DUF2007 domain-containing protein [Sphingobacteriaceae bacterium WQ 2009]